MSRIRIALVALLCALGLLVTAAPAQAAPTVVTAHFSSPTTDGLSKVTGTLRVIQSAPNQPVIVRGKVSGLQPNSLFVPVPYIGKGCIPVPGVLAFPGGAFFTDSTGVGRVFVQVNPKSINPLGMFSAAQTGSVSIRRVVVQGTSAGGFTVPNLPQVAATEACDSNPTRTG